MIDLGAALGDPTLTHDEEARLMGLPTEAEVLGISRTDALTVALSRVPGGHDITDTTPDTDTTPTPFALPMTRFRESSLARIGGEVCNSPSPGLTDTPHGTESERDITHGEET
jgi:hypothetical protein